MRVHQVVQHSRVFGVLGVPGVSVCRHADQSDGLFDPESVCPWRVNIPDVVVQPSSSLHVIHMPVLVSSRFEIIK